MKTTLFLSMLLCLIYQAQSQTNARVFLADNYKTHAANHVITSSDFDEIDLNKIEFKTNSINFSKLKKLNYKICDEFGASVKEGEGFNGDVDLHALGGGSYSLFIWRGKGKFVQQVKLIRQ